MEEKFYSIRMRASHQGRHISGAERLVPLSHIEWVTRELTARGLAKADEPDQISVQIEVVDKTALLTFPALDVTTINVRDPREGLSAAIQILCRIGVSQKACDAAVAALTRGASPRGETMRGAVIMDAENGERLEPDQERGIRASRFDWSEEARSGIGRQLGESGLTHFRTQEALVLASKVAHGPGMMAELCWSDDPAYTAGYVASLRTGYVRFPHLKEPGRAKGGRVFFVHRPVLDLEALIRYLQSVPVLINQPGTCKKKVSVLEYFDSLDRKSCNHV